MVSTEYLAMLGLGAVLGLIAYWGRKRGIEEARFESEDTRDD